MDMNLLEKLKKIKDRFDQVHEELSDPATQSNREKVINLSRERINLTEIVAAYESYKHLLSNIDGNKEIIDTSSDKELNDLANAELKELLVRKDSMEEEIKILLIPKDPNDDKNIIMEIRAGTGGDEAALFAGDLFRMYSRYAEVRGWKIELIDISETGLGGIRKLFFRSPVKEFSAILNLKAEFTEFSVFRKLKEAEECILQRLQSLFYPK